MRPTIQLNYAPPPPWLRRRRTRRLFALVILALGLCAGWRYRQPIWFQTQVHYWEWRCAHYAAPADQVIFSNDPADIAALQNDPAYIRNNQRGPAILRKAPDCWTQWGRLTGQKLTNHPALGFVHRMRNSRGEMRLVAVTFGTTRHGHIFKRESTFGMPTRISSTCLGYATSLQSLENRPLRIYAGHVDPANPSHLILPFDHNGQRGSIDIYLQDDDRLRQEFHLPAKSAAELPISDVQPATIPRHRRIALLGRGSGHHQVRRQRPFMAHPWALSSAASPHSALRCALRAAPAASAAAPPRA